MKEEIKKIIDEIKPSIKAHGGDIEFVDFDEKEKIVKVRLRGACAHCPMSGATLENIVLSAIKEKYPDIESVENAE
ncbi:NifU family protein [Patescibacteria group bacterium]|nr:NifU family protein [Patescibacteria group bacterium]